ncbi:MAG TPA: hypothetical protein DDZ80_19030, partial [Cyanobacteria bacterium UBA8803]|nr:hypothetical protein [Cyanobacteria bacterium UBA8803]
YAAIDYFFGRRGSNLSQTDTPESSSLPPTPQAQVQQLAGDRAISQPPTVLPPTATSTPDPWLTWDDLFGNPLTKDLTQNPTHSAPNHYAIAGESPNPPAQLPEGFNSKMPLTRGNPVWRVIKRYLSAQKSLSKIYTP